MILRHAREPMEGQSIENTFEAVDERSGETLASCAIYMQESQQLFPARPTRIYMEIEGDPAPDALLGAAVARAKELALQAGSPCRIFTQVDPQDSERMVSLAALGFKDTDGLVRLRRELPGEPCGEMPIGCVVVRDELDDPIEQKYFLERYNQLFNEEYDFEWLQDFRNQQGFKRILIVAPTGMAGEIVVWKKAGAGEIGWLFTSKKWRRKGVAQRLLELACQDFWAESLSRVDADVQAKIPSILHTLERAGFRQAELLQRYPGIDIG